MKNKIVKIIGTSSISKDYLGRYGVVTQFGGEKYLVEFNSPTKTTGALRITVSKEDFEVIGQLY